MKTTAFLMPFLALIIFFGSLKMFAQGESGYKQPNHINKEVSEINVNRNSLNETKKHFLDGSPCPGDPTVTDADGNVYNTVMIGDQCWMKENLKTTKYKNNTPIDYPGNNNYDWIHNTTGAYAWYNNNISWKDKYGALYNWYAVDNSNGLCPEGWHVPTREEWATLRVYAGDDNGNKLKSCRQVNSPQGGECNTTEHPRWDEDTIYGNYGTDDYGFAAFPGSTRDSHADFGWLGHWGHWWSSTTGGNNGKGMIGWGAFTLELYCNAKKAFEGYYGYRKGISVRCIRDD